jgi:S1-C subfamily serine protease
MARLVSLAVLVGVVFGAGLLAGRALDEPAPGTRPAAVGSPNAPSLSTAAATIPVDPLPSGLAASELRDIEIFRRASPSTVFISRIVSVRRGFSFDVTRMEQGSGSGFVWDTDGHVVTNFHVIDARQGTEYVVKLADRSEWEARIVGVAPEKDLAVLRIEAPRALLEPLARGVSADLAVGQKVLALGNPFGLDQTLTVGIVSAVGRDLTSPTGRIIRDVIQTDAAINPGNSGGPLLDSSGRLIGVNTAIYSPSGAYAGIGFAIPVDTVEQLVPQLIRYGEPIRPGIGIVPAYDSQARRLGIEGVVIVEVLEGTPAARAGLTPVTIDRRGRISGDVIVGANGQRVRTLAELQDVFEAAGGAGATVTLEVANSSGGREVRLELIELNRE